MSQQLLRRRSSLTPSLFRRLPPGTTPRPAITDAQTQAHCGGDSQMDALWQLLQSTFPDMKVTESAVSGTPSRYMLELVNGIERIRGELRAAYDATKLLHLFYVNTISNDASQNWTAAQTLSHCTQIAQIAREEGYVSIFNIIPNYNIAGGGYTTNPTPQFVADNLLLVQNALRSKGTLPVAQGGNAIDCLFDFTSDPVLATQEARIDHIHWNNTVGKPAVLVFAKTGFPRLQRGERAFVVSKQTVVVGGTRLRAGGFRIGANGYDYQPPSLDWYKDSAMEPITLTDAHGMNIDLTGIKIHDTRLPLPSGQPRLSCVQFNFASQGTGTVKVDAANLLTFNDGFRGDLRGRSLEIINTNGQGHQFGPTDYGLFKGRFFDVTGGNVISTNNYHNGLGGGFINGAPVGAIINSSRNRIVNVDGRILRQDGTYGFIRYQAMQVNAVTTPFLNFDDNWLEDDPVLAYSEDRISFHGCVGATNRRPSCRRNFINRGTGPYARYVFDQSGARQDGYSGTAIMHEGSTSYVETEENYCLQTTTGIVVAIANNNSIRRNTIASTGRYLIGPWAGKIMPRAGQAHFTQGTQGFNTFDGNRTAGAFHVLNDDSPGNENLKNDTISRNDFGQNSAPNTTIINHKSWDAVDRVWADPYFQVSRNGNPPEPNNYNGRGLADSQLIADLVAEATNRIIAAAGQGQYCGPAV